MKQIKHVRRSIQERKKKRSSTIHQEPRKTSRQIYPAVTDEEKHGFLHMPTYDMKKETIGKPGRPTLLKKLLLSIGLFVFMFFILQNESTSFQTTNKTVRNILTEDFPFAKVNTWYEHKFGSPFVLFQDKNKKGKRVANEKAMPVNGNVKETFAANGTGVQIQPKQESVVHAIKDGVVVFSGKRKATNRTIIIQHADGSKSTYGHLDNTNVHLYEHVRSQDKIGYFKPTSQHQTVFFSVEKNDKYIDPISVIKVDQEH